MYATHACYHKYNVLFLIQWINLLIVHSSGWYLQRKSWGDEKLQQQQQMTTDYMLYTILNWDFIGKQPC